MNLIKRWFANDWKPIWIHNANWKVKSDLYHDIYLYKCGYEIEYSKKRNEYRLNIYGYQPKMHNDYQIAVQKLNEFVKNGH